MITYEKYLVAFDKSLTKHTAIKQLTDGGWTEATATIFATCGYRTHNAISKVQLQMTENQGRKQPDTIKYLQSTRSRKIFSGDC